MLVLMHEADGRDQGERNEGQDGKPSVRSLLEPQHRIAASIAQSVPSTPDRICN